MDIRSTVNYVLWSGMRDRCFIEIEDRLTSMHIRIIHARDIVKVDASYVYLRQGSVIPLHRIRKIVCNDDVLLAR